MGLFDNIGKSVNDIFGITSGGGTSSITSSNIGTDQSDWLKKMLSQYGSDYSNYSTYKQNALDELKNVISGDVDYSQADEMKNRIRENAYQSADENVGKYREAAGAPGSGFWSSKRVENEGDIYKNAADTIANKNAELDYQLYNNAMQRQLAGLGLMTQYDPSQYLASLITSPTQNTDTVVSPSKLFGIL